MTTSGESAPFSRQRSAELSTREILVWGAVGGLFFVAVNAGLFDLQQIKDLLGESAKPSLQLSVLAVFAGITVFAGAAWATLHRPLKSCFVAVQLGTIAPLAITALVNYSGANLAGLTADLGWTNGLIISSAYASDHSEESTTTTDSSTLECIIKSIVKQPC